MLTDEQLSELESLPVAEDKDKNIEELIALPVASEEDGTGTEVVDNGFGGPEFLARSARAGLSGFLLSDLPASAATALGSTLYDYISTKDYKGADQFMADFKGYLSGDQARQKEFLRQYPTWSTVFEVGGGLLPGSIGGRLVEGVAAKGAEMFGQKAAYEILKKEFPQAMKGMPSEAAPIAIGTQKGLAKGIGELAGKAAVAGAGVGVLQKGGEQLTEAIAGNGKTPIEQAAELGQAAVTGGVAAPVVGLGLAAGVTGLQKAEQAVSGSIKKAATSKPVLSLIQVLTGPKVEAQQNYLKFFKEIENLPSEQAVSEVLDNVKNRLRTLSQGNKEEVIHLESTVKDVSNQLDAYNTSLDMAGEQRSGRLDDLKRELINLQQDLTAKKSTAKNQLDTQIAQIADQRLKPDVSESRVAMDQALDDAKEILNQKSKDARELLDPKFRVVKDVIIRAAKRQLKSIAVPGTKGAFVSKAEQQTRSEISDFIDFIKNPELPTFLNADQVKYILQKLDGYIEKALPGQYSDLTERSFWNIRSDIDGMLKSSNEKYKEAMIPVADLTRFLKDASFVFNKDIKGVYDKALDDKVLRDKILRLQQYTDQDILEPLEKLQNFKQENTKLAKLEQTRQLPGYKTIKDAEDLLNLSKMQDFEKAAYENIDDKLLAQQIISLRRNIKALTEPNRVENDLNAKILNGQVTLEEAKQALSQAKSRQNEFDKRFQILLNNNNSENLVTSILKNPNAKAESEAAANIINAITQLPDKEFSDFMQTIGLTNPKEFADITDYLRMRSTFDKSFTNGSRRVQLVKGLVDGLAGLIGFTTGGPAGGVASTVAMSSLTGGLLDDFGAKATKAYLKSMSQLGGLPTMSKIERLSPLPITGRLRNALTSQLTLMSSEIDPKKWFYVSNDQIPELENDIKTSKLSPIERAKILKQLYSTNYIDGSTIQTLLMGSDTPTKEKKFLDKVFKPEKRTDLKIDNPKILKALEQGA